MRSLVDDDDAAAADDDIHTHSQYFFPFILLKTPQPTPLTVSNQLIINRRS